MTADQPTLKPCPFCGGSDIGKSDCSDMQTNGTQFTCNGCGASIQGFGGSTCTQRAVAAWNRRAPVEITAEMVERGRISAVEFAKAEQGDGFFYIADAPHEREAVRRILAAALNHKGKA